MAATSQSCKSRKVHRVCSRIIAKSRMTDTSEKFPQYIFLTYYSAITAGFFPSRDVYQFFRKRTVAINRDVGSAWAFHNSTPYV